MNLIHEIEKYLRSLPNYLVGSGAAFLTDLVAYTALKPHLGISKSLSISFLIGTSTLYCVLRRTTNSRIIKKRIGILLQTFIGLGSFLINYVALIQLERLLSIFSVITMSVNAYLLTAATKITAACLGFIWSSYLTMRLNFESK